MNVNSSNKYALVTGGSSGMGLEYVRQLAEKGYNLIIVALFQHETDAVKDEISAAHPELDVISIGMDLSAFDAAQSLYDRVMAISPDIAVEVLINNAGILCPYHFAAMTAEQVSRIIMIHNHTLAMLCHLFLPQMLARRKGYIMNISSMAAWLAYPFITTYSATKAFTKQFSRSIRCELRGTGVQVSTIYFGAVATNLYTISPKLIKLAKALGIMITPQKAARIALRMMFRGRSGRIPGFINRFAICFTALIPMSWIAALDKAVTRHWHLK